MQANLVVAGYRDCHVQAILDAASLLRDELLFHALSQQALAGLRDGVEMLSDDPKKKRAL